MIISEHMFRLSKNRYLNIIATIILLISAGLMLQRFTDPWTRIEDANSLIYSYYAKNLLRYPDSLHQYINLNAVSQPPQPTIVGTPYSHYLDHSPLLSYMVAFFFIIYGFSEWAARLVPLLSSIGSLAILFYWLGRWTPSVTIKLASLFILAFSPVFVEQAQIVNFEPPTMFFLLLASGLLIEGYWEQKSKAKLWGYIFWVIAMLIDWPATFLTGTILILIWLKNKPAARSTQSLKKMRTLKKFEITLPILLPLLANGLVFWINSQPVPHLFQALIAAVFYSPNQASFLSAYQYLMPTFLSNNYFYILGNFTIIPLIASLIWLYTKYKKRGLSQLEWLAISFFFIGFLNVFLFPAWATHHRYWTYYFLPFFAITTGLAVTYLFKTWPKLPTMGILSIGMIYFLRSGYPTIQKRIYTIDPTPEQMAIIKQLSGTQEPIYTNKDIYVLGQGRRVRYYADRPLKIIEIEGQTDLPRPFIFDKRDSHLLSPELIEEAIPLDYLLLYLPEKK